MMQLHCQRILYAWNDQNLFFLFLIFIELLSKIYVLAKNAPIQFPLCTHQSPVTPLSPFTFSKQPKAGTSNTYSNLNDRVIGILPAPNSPPSQLLLTEPFDKATPTNSTTSSSSKSPFDRTTCAIRLEACAHCLISLELESTSAFFTEFQIEKVSRCDDLTSLPLQPCFNFIIVEERADESPLALQSFINLGLYSASSNIKNSPFHRQFSLGDQFHEKISWFNSTGSSLLVLAVMRNLEADAQLFRYIHTLFPIKILVVDNSEIVEGQPTHSILLTEKESSIGFIKSPRFPEPYPRILHKNYTLVNRNSSGFVRLVFDDFYVHYLSDLKILDSDGKELFSTRKEHRRPPALVSSGMKLTLMFEAKDFTQIVGFKARYEFVDSTKWLDQPTAKNCDDYLENYGGRISLDGQKQLVNNYIDCIWLIGRFPAISRTFDQIYLRLEEFHFRGSKIRLEVRRGTHSGAERVLLLFDEHTVDPLEQKQPNDGFLTDHSQPAYYIRLRGFLKIDQGLSLIYTHFYRWATALCPGAGEFHCNNSKCVKSMLRCDGFNHCGDGTDELCTLPNIVLAVDSFNLPNLFTIVVGILSTIIILLMLIVLTFTVTRKNLIFQLGFFMRRRRRRRVDRNSQRAATAQNLGASISTIHQSCCSNNSCFHSQFFTPGNLATSQVSNSDETSHEQSTSEGCMGQRRFFMLPPEHQIPGVIEAPPTYADALKHPSVPPESLRQIQRSFTNAGFSTSRSEDIQLERSSQPSLIETTSIEPLKIVELVQPCSSSGQEAGNSKACRSKSFSTTWPLVSAIKRPQISGSGSYQLVYTLQQEDHLNPRRRCHSSSAKLIKDEKRITELDLQTTSANNSSLLNRSVASNRILNKLLGEESWV